ncbi:MAG: hypothetical protein LBI40_01150 [Treponema sp.]|nr:hypothetical protein [Treponema sp.]
MDTVYSENRLCPWRDLPLEYGYWHVVYDQFSRVTARRLWATVLLGLQEEERTAFKEMIKYIIKSLLQAGADSVLIEAMPLARNY